MPSLEPILEHVTPFLLVLFRISGLMMFSPVLSSSLLPARVRAMLAICFSLAVYPTLIPILKEPV